MRLLAIAAVALAIGVAAPVAASVATTITGVDDFSFESFDGEYFLGTDDDGRATTRVVETIVARFPDFDQNRGIVRAIPNVDGEVPLHVTMISITDENGVPVPYERSDYEGFAEFALGTDDFVHGLTTYVLEYTLANTIRHFDDASGPGGVDEFYWDINGNGWPQGFDTVSARVFVPEELAASLTGGAACFLGYYGDTGECSIERNDAGTQFDVSVGPVASYNTLTVSIGFDGGTVTPPALPRDHWVVAIAPKVLLGLAALLVVIAAVVRKTVLRPARGRGTIIAQYEPPTGSTLLLDANIIERTSSALPALLVDFAVRGMIRIVDNDPGTPVGDEDDRFSIELVTADGANPQELRVLVTLFGVSLSPGKRVNPGSLSADIGASLYGLPAQTAALVLKEGLRAEHPSRIPRILKRVALGTVFAFLPIWIWAATFDVLEDNVIGPLFGTIGLAIVVATILARRKLLTRKGAEAREYLLGLKEYLTIAEEDRMRVLQSPQGALRVDVTDHDAIVKLNERLLPYAVLWGVEDEWVEKLRAEYPDSTPAWLESDGFNSSLFRNFTLGSVSSVRPIVTSSSSGGSSWSSSGGSSFSSGSSGGGFSGGGGGGGGGGGR